MVSSVTFQENAAVEPNRVENCNWTFLPPLTFANSLKNQDRASSLYSPVNLDPVSDS
ncbi:hypothetical protein QN277_016817 [Acacia crassicarpa]|uniref:Uncharacterized protein n=1 Tax=Acacia crassicarpa TaxID=499986 RepID=A0AAE1MXJ6_9FABA|nr:hypothetical protein QN277_016817 [Acacia crassicarpa]